MVTKPPHAASVGLLDLNHVVLVDPWSDPAVQPAADVGVRAAYMRVRYAGLPGHEEEELPILLLLNLTLRKDAHVYCGMPSTERTGRWPFPDPDGKKYPFHPLLGLVNPGKIDGATFEAAVPSGKPLVIISDDACVDFMPVLRNRPVLRGVYAAASPLNTTEFRKALAAAPDGT